MIFFLKKKPNSLILALGFLLTDVSGVLGIYLKQNSKAALFDLEGARSVCLLHDSRLRNEF